MPDQLVVDLAPGPTGGLTVPVDAYNLFLDLTAGRDLVLVHVGDRLRVSQQDGSAPVLTEDDRDQIRKWKHHLLALLAYEAPPVP